MCRDEVNYYLFFVAFAFLLYLTWWWWGNTIMSCCFVASFCQSDKNLSNRHDYLSRLPFASLFIDNSWLITETVSNLQENQSSSWRRPQGAATTPTLPSNAHLCSNADAHCTHMLPTLPSNAHALPICAHLMLKCSSWSPANVVFLLMLKCMFKFTFLRISGTHLQLLLLLVVLPLNIYYPLPICWLY